MNEREKFEYVTLRRKKETREKVIFRPGAKRSKHAVLLFTRIEQRLKELETKGN